MSNDSKEQQPLRLGILASGRGSNAQAIHAVIQSGALLSVSIAAIASNKKNAPVLAWAEDTRLPCEAFDNKDFQSRELQEASIIKYFKNQGVNLVVLAGYMRIVSPDFIEAFGGQVLNIHPSLLPKHGGPGMVGHKVHSAVLAAGDTESGCTVHWVTPTVDGGPIVWQERVPVLPGDNPDTLAARVLAAEHQAYPLSLQQLASQPYAFAL
ncbi:MAG: phosphoribosylglycinamide formyltransferase [Vampirovibrionales bacterium]|nr:phosphoribosylglycinamide formyltransferase [Vampirovibrionales bacterium]